MDKDSDERVVKLQTRFDREAKKQQALEISDSDVANGKRFAKRYGSEVHYTPECEWLVWDGRRWAVDERAINAQKLAKATALAIYDEIKDSTDRATTFRHARNSQSKRSLEAMLWCGRSEDSIPTKLIEFDRNPWLLNVANGTLDLRSATLRAHAREDKISKLVPIEYDERAECLRWLRFLAEITAGNLDLIAYLQRVVGYCLTGLTQEQVLHFLFGFGANGKSVFCDVLADLLGEYCIVCSPEMIVSRKHSGIPNDIARLRGQRLALMNETSQGSSFDEAKLKDLTGSDKLCGRFLRAELFDFSPTHKLIIRGNYKPAISGTDDGIWRRLRLVPFTVSIPPDKRDGALHERLKHELSGILRWAVEGCLAWQMNGLDPPAAVLEASQEYRVESDTLGRFIDECCNRRGLAQVKSSVLFKAYQEFAQTIGERWMPSKDLPHEMQRRGVQWKRTNLGGMFYGLELRDAGRPSFFDQE